MGHTPTNGKGRRTRMALKGGRQSVMGEISFISRWASSRARAAQQPRERYDNPGLQYNLDETRGRDFPRREKETTNTMSRGEPVPTTPTSWQ